MVLKIICALLTQTLDIIVSTMAVDKKLLNVMWWDGAGTQNSLCIAKSDHE
jgi:hypothetical protein